MTMSDVTFFQDHHRGGMCPGAKLSWNAARVIRAQADTVPAADQARRYSVSVPTIARLLAKKAWWPDPESIEKAA